MNSRMVIFVVVALVLVVLIARFWPATRELRPSMVRTTPPPEVALQSPSSRLPWPLAVGNSWVYREERRDPATSATSETTVTVTVEREERGGAFRISEREGTRNRASYVLDPRPDGLMIAEFQSSTPRRLLPATLEPGMTWDLGKTGRATARASGNRTVDGHSVPCVAIDYERLYDAEKTEEPGWYPDGTWWVSPGVGVVAKDNGKAVRPRPKSGIPAAAVDNIQRWTLVESRLTSRSSAGP